MQSAIVLDGGLKSALAIVRSLGAKQITLSVGAERKTAMSLHSRYTGTPFVYPSPYHEETAFINVVEKEAMRMGDMPVIFACSDATYLALYRARERLSRVAMLVFPDERAMETAFDKAITYSLARISGIPTITTYIPATVEELHRVANTIKYPAVIKPRKSVTKHNGMHHFESAHFVHTKEDLLWRFDMLTKKIGETPLIQDRLMGEEYGVEMIAHEGNPYALVTHHRLRSLSPTGGASVLKETIEKGALRDMLETYARKIVSELKWEGPIMVEFKVDGDVMTPKLMEVNGRFWGSLPLSIAAGVDMPYHYYHLVTKGTFPSEAIMQRDRIVTRHFWGDVRNLLIVFVKWDKMRRHTYPKRLEALKLFFKTPSGTKGDVWSLRDPKPAMMEIIDILMKLWK